MSHPLLGSKKGMAMLIAVAIAALGTANGWTSEQILVVISPLGAYLPAEMMVDRARAKAVPPPEVEK